MTETVLVTGGAGFIGSHLVSSLLRNRYNVKIVDALLPQVHGANANRPSSMPDEVCFFRGDLCDEEALNKLLEDVDVIVHLAADVGVGQSMYEIVRYVRHNTLATATLLQMLIQHRRHIRKLVVASSMSIYGEGAYLCNSCGPFYPRSRSFENLQSHHWEMRCVSCKRIASPIPTSEDKPLFPNSVYAITKRDHEELCLAFGNAYEIPTVALRFFNVYGPGQHLSNPYTGVTAIFSTRLMNHMPPVIFEDGQQTRDFVHLVDVVRSVISAINSPNVDCSTYNIGTGQPREITYIANLLAKELEKNSELQITNQFRIGDVRHCYADTSRATQRLGFSSQIGLEDGIKDFVAWVKTVPSTDQFTQAHSELVDKGLIR